MRLVKILWLIQKNKKARDAEFHAVGSPFWERFMIGVPQAWVLLTHLLRSYIIFLFLSQ